MNTLIHICCANCATYPLSSFAERGVDFTGFWYNPNIHPLTEYGLRRDALNVLQSEWNFKVIYENRYDLKAFLKTVLNTEGSRCKKCYTMRLEETAKRAKSLNYQSFTTTLLYSIYQKFDYIIDTGRELSEKYDIEFYEEDFRTGWGRGIELSKSLSLYRQKYCGCIFSEMERYAKKIKIEKDA
ncbi:epoxyqueuosine reductase QueH [Candidatus Magnetomonas plexicatena]|uniref:epoxyqueuosine reductase QueH n=1 Tax=Candidatus Magnetomonas plexicatena TaxID=2552947 RepID=UPI001C75B723|nr:epoxyqueuosine reductase QueH [Nitrospirales bacterium LBB_01]